jgi:hypothetical protein
MATKRYFKSKRSNTKRGRKRGGKKTMKNKKQWTTAIDAAQSTLAKTGSLSKAKQVLKAQALVNARKLFGSVGEQM